MVGAVTAGGDVLSLNGAVFASYAGFEHYAISGGLSDDSLQGGALGDTLRGNDLFEFGVPLADNDTLRDFDRRADRIDLSGLDAVAGGDDDAFVFLGTAAFAGVAGSLRYDKGPLRTVVSGDVNGDSVADFEIELTGRVTLTAGDFIL